MHVSILSQLRGFVRAFLRYEPAASIRHRGHAIAKTIKHGTTVIGGNVNASLGNVGHSRREEMMTEASERYDASFEEK
jgi:hypothetical protein